MRTSSILSAFSALVLMGSAASAQTIYGLDVRLARFFTADASNFTGTFTSIAPNALPIFALDFDETATTLWGVNNTTLEYGTFDLGTGVFTASGTVTGIGTTGATGLTCDVNGVWYLSQFVTGIGTNLYVGDVTAGTFTLVGLIDIGIIIDIAIDSQGNMYGNSISNDNLYSVNTSTGAGTLIGPTGQATNFAQGMDFDWSTDTLYATLYTGGGTGVFASMNLTTGAAVVIQSTTTLNSEMEMAVQVAAGGCPIIEFCNGDGSGTACPFANNNDGSNGIAGCANSASTGGGKLSFTGCNDIGAGDLVLVGSSLAPSQPGLYFQGDNAINGGNGTVFGDGLRCAGGNVVRLQVRTASAGGASNTTVNIGVVGGVSSGQTKRYQLWYRDPVAGLTGFNFTNGIEVPWQ